MTSPLQILRNTFGFQDFRGVQEQVIGRVMAGAADARGDADRRGQVALLPGAGAGAARGRRWSISPLIALMHDQIRAAEAFGIRAAALTSADDNRGRDDRAAEARRARPALRRARAGDRAGLPRADRAAEAGADRDRRGALRLRMGPRFPARLPAAAAAARRLPGRAAARADRDRRPRAPASDILVQLGIPADGLIVAGFDRPNIRYHVRPRDGDRGATEGAARRAAGAGHRLRPEPRQGREARRAARRRPAGRLCPIMPGSSRRCARATRPRSSLARRW